MYKGRVYRLLRQETNQYGNRVKLAFLDGSKDFWADAALVSVREPTPASAPPAGTNDVHKPAMAVVAAPESNGDDHSEQDIPF
jgi:hypothetical protein